MDQPGIEPGAFPMRMERDTPTPQTHCCKQIYSITLLLFKNHNLTEKDQIDLKLII